jgi:hypothetical protein
MLEWLTDVRKVVTVRGAAGSEPGYLRLAVRLKGGLGQRQREAERLGVTRSYPRPIRELSEIRSRIASDLPTPGAALLAAELITLPTHSLVTEHDTASIRDLLMGA